MFKLDTILAPRPLTSAELASLIAPQLIMYGLTNRAITHAYVWDEERREGETRHAAESTLQAITTDAMSSVDDWLGDMQNDGEPRFYNKAGLKKGIDGLLTGAAQLFGMVEDAGQLETLISNIEGREPGTLEQLIELAAQ